MIFYLIVLAAMELDLVIIVDPYDIACLISAHSSEFNKDFRRIFRQVDISSADSFAAYKQFAYLSLFYFIIILIYNIAEYICIRPAYCDIIGIFYYFHCTAYRCFGGSVTIYDKCIRIDILYLTIQIRYKCFRANIIDLYVFHDIPRPWDRQKHLYITRCPVQGIHPVCFHKFRHKHGI